MAAQSILFVALMVVLTLVNSLEILSPNQIRGVYYHIDGRVGDTKVYSDSSYNVVLATPDLGACTPLSEDDIDGNVVLIVRGPLIMNNITINPDMQCRFTTKILYAQEAGAVGVIIGNNVGETDIVSMYEDTTSHLSIIIPSVSISKQTFEIMYTQLIQGEIVRVKINDKGAIGDMRLNSAVETWITAMLSTLLLLSAVSLIIAGILTVKIFLARLRFSWHARQRALRIHKIPIIKYSSDLLIAKQEIKIDSLRNNEIVVTDIEFDTNRHEENVKLIGSSLKEMKNGNKDKQSCLHNETCNVCLNDFIEGEDIKLLYCKHAFHEECIKLWIIKKGKCPVCKRDVFMHGNSSQLCI